MPRFNITISFGLDAMSGLDSILPAVQAVHKDYLHVIAKMRPTAAPNTFSEEAKNITEQWANNTKPRVIRRYKRGSKLVFTKGGRIDIPRSLRALGMTEKMITAKIVKAGSDADRVKRAIGKRKYYERNQHGESESKEGNDKARGASQ